MKILRHLFSPGLPNTPIAHHSGRAPKLRLLHLHSGLPPIAQLQRAVSDALNSVLLHHGALGGSLCDHLSDIDVPDRLDGILAATGHKSSVRGDVDILPVLLLWLFAREDTDEEAVAIGHGENK